MWSEGVPGVAAEWECDSGEQTLQALHALEELVVAERVRHADVAGGAERLAGNHSDLCLLEDEAVSYTHLTLPTNREV